MWHKFDSLFFPAGSEKCPKRRIVQTTTSLQQWWVRLPVQKAMCVYICRSLKCVWVSELVIKLRKTPVGIWNSLAENNRRQGKSDPRSTETFFGSGVLTRFHHVDLTNRLTECDRSRRFGIYTSCLGSWFFKQTAQIVCWGLKDQFQLAINVYREKPTFVKDWKENFLKKKRGSSALKLTIHTRAGQNSRQQLWF